MAGVQQASAFLDRDSERGLLGQLFAEVRDGTSRVLVLRGEAGVGKTALLRHVSTGLDGCRVALASGVESEMELPFAGLHALCVPLLDGLERLPAPQRVALGIAFGLESGPPPDRFLVGLAVLSLLADAADAQPLLCIIDDAQWLDRVSAQTLAFVARRLLAERVGLIFAVRESAGHRDELDGLPELRLTGLGGEDAETLFDTAILSRIDAGVRSRILDEAQGNPLALIELPRGLSPAELAGGFAVSDTRSLTTRIEQSFLERFQPLPREAQLLLLTAAAEPLGDTGLLWRAAEQLGLSNDAGRAAESAGLIELGPRVRFPHPLVRSAIYRSADPVARRDVHRALAEATDAVLDPDRRAWHSAHATAAPDETVAVELSRSAERARSRGGLAAAAAFLQRAAQLTPDPALRADRALVAAQTKLDVADVAAASELLITAQLGPVDELQRARRERLAAQIVAMSRRGRDAPPLLLQAARTLEPLDAAMARETYLEAFAAAMFAGRLGDGVDEAAIASAAAAVCVGEPAGPAEQLLHALVLRFTEGYAASAPQLLEAVRAFSGPDGGGEDRRWLWFACRVSQDLWDDELWSVLATTGVRLARETGALHLLPNIANYLGVYHVHTGDFPAAAILAEETEAIAEAADLPPLKYATCMLSAHRGDKELPIPEFVMDEALVRGEGSSFALKSWLESVMHLARGEYADALTAASWACEHEDVMVYGWALADLVEAAVRCGAEEQATSALEQLAVRTQAAGTPWALGVEARCRALVTGDETAYRESIQLLARSYAAVELARSRLLYGEWLRRQKRRADAREHLRAAFDSFTTMGAATFAERARRELEATGETVRRATADSRDALTPQELQVARLARGGLTNAEIGAQLFISPRTAEYHLRKVFRKLGITGRSELRAALDRVTDPV